MWAQVQCLGIEVKQGARPYKVADKKLLNKLKSDYYSGKVILQIKYTINPLDTSASLPSIANDVNLVRTSMHISK